MSLTTKIQTAIDAAAAEMGVAVHHIESGEEVLINPDRPFPMASVLKIPVLVEAFRQLNEGRFRLDDRWTLSDPQKNLGSGILPFFEAGLTPTLRDLLTLMIIISDNTATDMVIHRLGGPQRIEQTMHAFGLSDIYFKITIRQIFEDCLPSADGNQDRAALAKQIQQQGMRRDGVAFSTRPDNNVSTPRAMTHLLCQIFRAEILDQAACDQMLDILLQQQLNGRLPRFLPAGTKVAHKTGTIGGIRNDSGIITLNEASHVAVTVFSQWDDEAVWGDPVATNRRIFEVETAFGEIGLALYEHFG